MICDGCGEDKDDVRTVEDPYAKEIYDEIIERNLCDECYQDRLEEI